MQNTNEIELTETEQTELWEQATEWAQANPDAFSTMTTEALIDARYAYLEDRKIAAKTATAAGAERRIRKDATRRRLMDRRDRRCLICGNTDPAYLTDSAIVVYGQPSRNPDPTGLAGYDPLEDIGRIPINACLICIADLHTGQAAIATLAENPAYAEALEAEKELWS